jgi:hypothetical protein
VFDVPDFCNQSEIFDFLRLSMNICTILQCLLLVCTQSKIVINMCKGGSKPFFMSMEWNVDPQNASDVTNGEPFCNEIMVVRKD